jgi:hypothetical protein
MNITRGHPSPFLVLGAMLLMLACGGSNVTEGQRQLGDVAVTVNPPGGRGSDAVVTIAYSSGAASPAHELRILVNSIVDGRNACYVYYDRATNTFALVKDGGSETTSLPVGHPGLIENSQCSLDGAKSSVQVDANTAKLQVGLQFKPSFAGKKNIYAYVEDASGSNTGLQPRGTWIVTSEQSPNQK